MPNIRLVLEYNGSKFHGWQSQPNVRTIEQELGRVLGMILRVAPPTIYASGRTDAGVHARGQVVNFRTETEPDLKVLSHSISSLMKNEVRVVKADVVPDDFHARKSARSKQYTYTIFYQECPPVLDYGQVWYVRPGLDLDRMTRAADALVGTHDFSSFRGSGCLSKNPTKTIFSSQIILTEPYLRYTVIGTGFLKQMIRNIIGTLVGMGRDKIEVSMVELLALKNRRYAGVTAPPQGLCLDWVEY